MLVLANGAFESGSTWMRAIIGSIIRAATGSQFNKVPYEFRSPLFPKKGVWLDENKIDTFLASGLHREENYLSRGHIFSVKARDFLISDSDVYVFNISRNLGDTLVSHYYHLIRQGKLREDYAQKENIPEGFDKYYWRFGRYKAYQLVTYHEVWDVDSPQIFASTYERLKSSFDSEIKAMGTFIGFDLTDEHILKIKQETAISNMQKARGQDKLAEHKRFFRKGVVGEWKTHFTPEMLPDLETIQKEGLGSIDTLKYHAIFQALEVKRRVANLAKVGKS